MSNGKKLDAALLHEQLLRSTQDDKLYKIRNDAKTRAVVTAKDYDEFRAMVAAAHLRPLVREDLRRQQPPGQRWNKTLH